MNIKSVAKWASLPSTRYQHPNGTIMDVKWEHDSDNGWVAVSNDWTNITRDLVFKITYWELKRDGWIRV